METPSPVPDSPFFPLHIEAEPPSGEKRVQDNDIQFVIFTTVSKITTEISAHMHGNKNVVIEHGC